MPDALFDLPNPAATEALGAALAQVVQPGDTLTLDGPLGAGKTSLTRGLAVALGVDARLVSSPTYTLLHQYQGRIPLVHVDAYRLSGWEELEGLGYDEWADDCLLCLEWSQRLEPLPLAESSLWRCRLAHGADGGRQAQLCWPAARSWTPPR